MHYIHAILVNVKDEINSHDEPMNALDEIKDYARDIAMSETEGFGEGNVFDWRTEEDAGRWSDEFPGKGVILGLESPDAFLKYFERYSSLPLENALETFELSEYSHTAWRSEYELSENDELEVIPNPRNGNVGRDGIPMYWSGIKNPPLVIDKSFIKSLWHGEVDDFYAYLIKKSLKLTTGEYQSDSNFYSVPDCSSKVSDKTREDVLKHPEHYALVFSDYHN